MLITWFGMLAASFIITGMINQMFPDGRFPLATILLVIVLSAIGAYLAHLYLGHNSIFTSAFIGAGISSSVLFYFFHTTGIFVQEPLPEEKEEAKK